MMYREPVYFDKIDGFFFIKNLKMRSAQTPFDAWAIMKKFILFAIVIVMETASLTVSKV